MKKNKNMEIPKIEKQLEIKMQENSKAVLHIYGTIGRHYWYDDSRISADDVADKLDEIGEVEEINVRINSGGGDVFESIAILNNLKRHQSKIRVTVDGLAASGASLIAMAGELEMFPTSMLMVHKAWTFAAGNADNLREEADRLDKIDSSVLAGYKEKFQGDEEDLKQLIAQETYLTAAECEDMFGAVILEESGEPEEPVDPNEVKNSILNKIRMQKKEPSKVPAEPQVVPAQNILNKFKQI